MRKTTFALASIIAIALIFPATSGNAIAETEDVSVYAEHAPILIEGDDDFTPENGVTGGSGTELDPYIIEWWGINSILSDGIKISGTTACLVIRNVVIDGGDSSHDAISLAGCSNVSISYCTVSSAGTGINLACSRDIVVSGNQVSQCLSDGIIVEASSRVQVLQNDVRSNNWAPFHVWPCGVLIESPVNPDTRSDNVTIGGNVIQDNFGGAIGIGWLDDETSDILVVANTLTGNEDGVWTWGTRRLVISGNLIEGNQWGVYLEHTLGAKVHSNNFVNNGLQGYDDWGTENQWNDGYPTGGNYWSDYPGVDEFSGPDQDESGSDGIGDSPQVFEGGFDEYPLMEPYSPPTITEFAPPHSDYGIDTDYDGLFNYLVVEASVFVSPAGYYNLGSELFDSSWNWITAAGSNYTYLDAGLQTIEVLLEGCWIYDSGFDGPYNAQLSLYDGNGA